MKADPLMENESLITFIFIFIVNNLRTIFILSILNSICMKFRQNSTFQGNVLKG